MIFCFAGSRFFGSSLISVPIRACVVTFGGGGAIARGQAVIAGLKALEEENRNDAVGGDPLFAASGERADAGAGWGPASPHHAGPAMEVRWRVWTARSVVGAHSQTTVPSTPQRQTSLAFRLEHGVSSLVFPFFHA